MSLSSLSVLLLFVFLLFPSATSSDICKILSNYPSFSTFNNYLAQTHLAAEINSQPTITILVVDNSAMSPIAGKSMDVIKNILRIHAILDYYDAQKFQNLVNKNVTATTLFQTTGQASGGLGFLNITSANPGAVSFVSASPNAGAGASANLIKSVFSQSYSLSVLQISSVILPSGITDSKPSSKSPSPSPSPSVSPVPVPMHRVVSLVPVASPVPAASPVPVTSRAPVASPVPVPSLMPVLSPVPAVSPVPVQSPGPVVSPVPVISPVPVVSPGPVNSPVPVVSPVPVIHPVPVTVPVASPVPAVSPAPEISPVTSDTSAHATTAPADAGAGGVRPSDVRDGGDPKSGVARDHFWVNSWTGVITLLSMIAAIHMMP